MKTPVSISLDPACDWSWRTASWLNSVCNQSPIELTIRPLSLLFLYGEEINPDWVDMLTTSHGALRVIAAARAMNEDEAAIAAFYNRLGAAVHEKQEPLDASVVHGAVVASGLSEHLSAIDDDRHDDSIRANTERVIGSVGPDVGSPILEIGDAPRGFYGPVLEGVPQGAAAVALFDGIKTLITEESLVELKRGRS